jgi:hypothetical protein
MATEKSFSAVRRAGLRRSLRSARTAFIVGLAWAASCVWFGNTSFGNPINHGTFVGSSVTYVDVTEASATDPVPLFGEPSVFGNSLDFNPILFNALSQFGSAPDLTDGQLKFMVVAHAGKTIKNFSLNESGVTTVVGAGTDMTKTDVSAAGALNILEVDGVGTFVPPVPINLIFSHRPDGTWELVTDGEALTLPWSGSQFIDLEQVLITNNIPFTSGVTKISVDLDNALLARSEAGTIAFIDKKDFGGLSITVNIPEPASALLAILGLAGLVLLRRSGR